MTHIPVFYRDQRKITMNTIISKDILDLIRVKSNEDMLNK